MTHEAYKEKVKKQFGIVDLEPENQVYGGEVMDREKVESFIDKALDGQRDLFVEMIGENCHEQHIHQWNRDACRGRNDEKQKLRELLQGDTKQEEKE